MVLAVFTVLKIPKFALLSIKWKRKRYVSCKSLVTLTEMTDMYILFLVSESEITEKAFNMLKLFSKDLGKSWM
jgi:hypothetical protein